jgi:hypothetical protein
MTIISLSTMNPSSINEDLIFLDHSRHRELQVESNVGGMGRRQGEDEVAQQDHLLYGLFPHEKPFRRIKFSNQRPEVCEREADSAVFFGGFVSPIEQK